MTRQDLQTELQGLSDYIGMDTSSTIDLLRVKLNKFSEEVDGLIGDRIEKVESKPIDTCPHCQMENCVMDNAFRNAEHYGGGFYDIPCTKCGKMIQVHLERGLTLTGVEKSDKPLSESDF